MTTTHVVDAGVTASEASSTAGLHKQQPLLASIGSGVDQCKTAAAALRSCVQAATSSPDSCCALLRAAGAALAAVELAHSCAQDLKSNQLRQLLILSAALLAAMDLAVSCVKVDGRQSRWLTTLKRSQKNGSAAKTIVTSFQLLTQQAAALSDHNVLIRQQVQRRLFFGDPSGNQQPASMVVQQHLLLHQQQLVRGSAKMATVHCVLFIGSTLTEPHDEVWWSEGSPRSGSLRVHSLTTGATQVLDAAEGWGAVMCLHNDGHGNVWAGFRSGGVGLWSRAQRRLACLPLQCCKSSIRVIAADGCGHAYVGSQAGELMAVRLRFTRTCGAATLELAHSLLVQTNGAASGKLDAAHEGIVTGVTALDGRVWSSGGRGRSARLREWSMSGALHADVDLSTAGAAMALLAVPASRQLDSSPSAPVTVLSGHADGAVVVWLAEGTHGLQRLRQLPAPVSAGAVRGIALCSSSALLLVAHAGGGVALRSGEVAASADDAAAGCPQHVVLLKVADKGSIQHLASSGGSGFVISGSHGITQVPQAELQQVAVDMGLVQVPQPSTPRQAPPISVRQLSHVGSEGIAAPAMLTARALVHLRGPAASSAGAASHHSQVLRVGHRAEVNDNASAISAFTAGGSPPGSISLSTGSVGSAHCLSGDMYDPVTAASMAASYAAAHVRNLSEGAVMMPATGVGSLLPQPPKAPRPRQGRGHTRRFSASSAVKPSACCQSAEALLQQMRHNTSMVDLNSVTEVLASTTARLAQRQQQQRQRRQQAAASVNSSSAPSPSSSTSPPAPPASGFKAARVERLAARLQLEGGGSGSIRRYSPLSSRRPSMTSVKESALEGCSAVDQAAVAATAAVAIDDSRLRRISHKGVPLGSSPLRTSSRRASANNLSVSSFTEQPPAGAPDGASPPGGCPPSIGSQAVPNTLPKHRDVAQPSVRRRSSVARASMDRPNSIARPSQDAQGVFQAAAFAAARASFAEEFRAARAARLGGAGSDRHAEAAGVAFVGSSAGSMSSPQLEQLRARSYPTAAGYDSGFQQPSSRWHPDFGVVPLPGHSQISHATEPAVMHMDAPGPPPSQQHVSASYSSQQQDILPPLVEASDGSIDHETSECQRLQSETLRRWQKSSSGAEEAALIAAQLMCTRQQQQLREQHQRQQQQQQQQELRWAHPLDIGKLPCAPPPQPYQQQQPQQQALLHTRQSVSRHSAPRFGLAADRRRTSVSRSSLPATSSTLRRRTPDPQLVSSWANRDTFLRSAAGQYLVQFSDVSFKQQIGDGSVGRVHLGKWQETDVAIKMLSSLAAIGIRAPASSRTSHDKMMRTLEHEVNILASIRHPNIVLFMGVCLEPPCLVTEFCARGSLYDVLRKAEAAPRAMGHHLDWPRRLGMALDAAKGLLQLHSHRPAILHRDLKSPNLLVDKHWRVKVGDFNLSRTAGSALTNSNLSANNPRWLAPEVITHQDYGFASDVYAFGIVLWELMTWRLPFEALNPWQIMVAVDRGERPEATPGHQLLGGGFVGLPHYQRLMHACWAATPQDRPPMEEVIAELRILIEVAQFEKKALAMQPPLPQRQPSGFTIAVPPTEAGSEADPATSVTSVSSADAGGRPGLRRRRSPLAPQDFVPDGTGGLATAPASYISMMQPYRPGHMSDADRSVGSYGSPGTAGLQQGAASPSAAQRPAGRGMPSSPFSVQLTPGQQVAPPPASAAQSTGGRWGPDAMLRTQWAAKQLAGGGGSGAGGLAHRAVNGGASFASLRAMYGTADPHSQVPSPTRAGGNFNPFSAFGSSMSAGSSNTGGSSLLQGDPVADGSTIAGTSSGSGAQAGGWHSMQQGARWPGGNGSDASPSGRSSVRSQSFSPSRASVQPSIRRRSEGIPPRPPSKLSLASGAARYTAAGVTEPPSPVHAATAHVSTPQYAAASSAQARRQLVYSAGQGARISDSSYRSSGAAQPTASRGAGPWPTDTAEVATSQVTQPKISSSSSAQQSDLSPLSSEGISPHSGAGGGANRLQHISSGSQQI